MQTLHDIPFVELSLNRHGERDRPRERIVPEGVTDLVIMSHGWKNDSADALALYAGILAGARNASDGAMHSGTRNFAAIGVHWPAFRYQKDLSLVRDDHEETGAGSAAALAVEQPGEATIRDVAAELAEGLCLEPMAFSDSASKAAGGGGAADDFLRMLRTGLADAPAEVKAEHRELLRAPGGELVGRLALGGDLRTQEMDTTGMGSAAGLGAAIADRGWKLLSGGKAAVATILNQATYFEMKARAGVVGAALAGLIDEEVPEGVQVHLVGHSFGARLVTSACASLQRVRPKSLSLLQGAFSHNGFGKDVGPRRIEGGFRRVMTDGLVTGPVLVTHTRRDIAVGFFYAVASAASGEIAKSAGLARRLVGGPADLHGGIGANGAQAMPESEAVAHVGVIGAAPELADGKVNNVLADAIISDHNDVANPQVGRLVWQAIR